MRYELLLDDIVELVPRTEPLGEVRMRASLIPATSFRRIDAFEAVVARCRKPSILLTHYPTPLCAASWYPARNTIEIDPQRFVDSRMYYSTLLHELVHSTGPVFNRRAAMVGLAFYSGRAQQYEELIAEIGSLFLRQEAGDVCHWDFSSKYLHEWLMYDNSFPNAKDTLRSAGAEARVAVNYLLQRSI